MYVWKITLVGIRRHCTPKLLEFRYYQSSESKVDSGKNSYFRDLSLVHKYFNQNVTQLIKLDHHDLMLLQRKGLMGRKIN